MSRRDWRLRVEDMLEAIRRIQLYVSGLTLEEFAADPKTIDAVVRNLEVMGEAARQIPDEARQLSAELPWGDIADMRNILAHEYFGVDMSIVWKTVTGDLPVLAEQLRKLLGTL